MKLFSPQEAAMERWQQYHPDRFPFLRPVHYDSSALMTQEGIINGRKGDAMTVNISSGGMCLLLEQLPDIGEVLRLEVLMPIPGVTTPTLGEVRWTRTVFQNGKAVFLAGLKFVI